MNVLQVTNKVLKRLREDEVVSTDESEYASLIAEFVADIHADCVEEHDWSSMNHYINLDLVAGQRTYDLGLLVADGGAVPDDERVTTTYSHIIMDKRNMPMAFLFDDENDDMGEQIFLEAMPTLDRLFQMDRDLDNLEPYHMAYQLSSSGGGLEVAIWPLPQTARLLRLKMWTPPTIVGDGTDDDTELLMPWRPVYLGALMMSLNERGEEIGEPGNMAERRYVRSLSSAIEADMKAGIHTNQSEVVRD